MNSLALLLWTLIGLHLFTCGCTRSMLQSTHLPIEAVEQVPPPLNMVYCLPKGMIHFKSDGKDVAVETVYVPDPDHYYTMAYLPRSSYDEEITVTLTPDQMLSQIDISSKPRIGDIIMQAFQLVKAIAKLPIGFARGPEERFFDVMIDPKVLLRKRPTAGTHMQDITALRQELQKLEVRESQISKKGKDITDSERMELLQLGAAIPDLKREIAERAKVVDKQFDSGGDTRELQSLGRLIAFCGIEDISLTRLFPAGTRLHVPSPMTGVKYRPLLPYRLEIKLPNYLFVKVIYLPNEASVITLDVTRPAFAERVTSLQFTNGVLTKIDLKRPSETLAFIKLPVELVTSIASLPMDLIKFRVENVSANTQLLEAQISEIRARQTLMELRQEKP